MAASGNVPQHHGVTETGSFWAMMTAIVAVVANELIFGAVQFAIKIAVAVFLGGIASVATAGYTGALGRMYGGWSAWKFRRRVRNRTDLVAELEDLLIRADRQISRGATFSGSFTYVFPNTVMEQVRRLEDGGAKPEVRYIDGLWQAWLMGDNEWGAIRDGIRERLASSARLDSFEFVSAYRLLRPYIVSFLSFATTLTREVRRLKVTWSQDQLDAWDAVRGDANELRERAIVFYRRATLEFEGGVEELWSQRVGAIFYGPEPESPASMEPPPRGVTRVGSAGKRPNAESESGVRGESTPPSGERP